MPFTVTQDVPRIVEVAFTAPITEADIIGATAACASLQKQTGAVAFLLDVNAWDAGGPLIELYNLVDKQYGDLALDRRTRIAVLQPTTASGQEAARFYETLCRNRGWIAQVCPDRAGAVAWLLKEAE